MSDYKETDVVGKAWSRCHQIVVDNVRGRPPAVQFIEERVLLLDDGQEIRQAQGPLGVDFDPSRLIPIRDPATGELTGAEATYGQAYVMLYSAYIDAALARDAAMVKPEPSEPLPEPLPDADPAPADQPTV